MATWGAYLVLPLMIIAYLINLYCCCKFFYFGGWAWPLKQFGRGVFRRYVAGVRTTSSGKMVFADLTDAEQRAAAHMHFITDAALSVGTKFTKTPQENMKALMPDI